MWREGDEDKEGSEEGVKLAVSLFIGENKENTLENHSTWKKSWDILTIWRLTATIWVVPHS